MAVDPLALTTLVNVKLYLNIDAGVTTVDTILESFINAASKKVETYCDRQFIKRIYTEYKDGFANDRFLLDQWPAVKPTEVWIDGKSQFTDSEDQLDVGDYELDLSSRGEGIGIVLVPSCGRRIFPRGTRNVKIVYEAGYDDVASLPRDLEDATIWTVDFLYKMRENESIQTAVKGKNQENITYREDLPMIVKQTLDSYKRCEWPTGSRAVFTG